MDVRCFTLHAPTQENRYDSIWGKTELNNRDVEKLHRLEIPCSNYQSNH